jgi:hypothetical protein
MSNIQAITYEDAITVTASDTVDDPKGPFAGFYTGTGGDIKVTTIRGTAQVFKGTVAGVVITCAIKRVWSSVTAATSVLGMVALPYKPPGPSS